MGVFSSPRGRGITFNIRPKFVHVVLTLTYFRCRFLMRELFLLLNLTLDVFKLEEIFWIQTALCNLDLTHDRNSSEALRATLVLRRRTYKWKQLVSGFIYQLSSVHLFRKALRLSWYWWEFLSIDSLSLCLRLILKLFCYVVIVVIQTS